MSYEIFNLNGYGFFVWPAFIFTFVSCLYLYLKVKKEFQKQEKIFLNEFKEHQHFRIEVDKNRKLEKPILSKNLV
tara:strand:+ start:301 stop:525 length:225 start_codon:yes stop_codon:yes gene_type:complete